MADPSMFCFSSARFDIFVPAAEPTGALRVDEGSSGSKGPDDDPRVPSRVRRVIQVTSVGYSSAAMISGHFHAAETGASRLEFAYHPVRSAPDLFTSEATNAADYCPPTRTVRSALCASVWMLNEWTKQIH